MTYDIVINTTYFEKCQTNKNFLLFTISVIMDGVSNKFDKTLNTEDYVILKNRKVCLFSNWIHANKIKLILNLNLKNWTGFRKTTTTQNWRS